MKPIVKAYFKLYPWLARTPIRSGLITGLALGLFDREDFHYLDHLNAGRTGKWSSEQHNLRGLLPWEKTAMESWFPTSGRLLITAVGGGREVLALEPMGYDLEGFECNPELAEAANQHLENLCFRSRVATCPRDVAPHVAGMFDGIIVGWGSYTLVMGRDTRITFLQALSKHLPVGAPLLISYFKREHSPGFADRVQHKLASYIRALRGAPQLEANDIMDWNFRHRFEDEEIESELVAAGFQAVHLGDINYPHAVGIRKAARNP